VERLELTCEVITSLLSAGADQQQPLIRPPSYAFGGHQPTLTQERRATTISALFILSAVTVARPHAVLPLIPVPSSLHAKWSIHTCWRGLNNRVHSD
jgi:hypothetical protein